MSSPARLARSCRRIRVRHSRLLFSAAVLVLVTACGSGAGGSESKGAASGNGRDAGLKYARCMRDHHVGAEDPDGQTGVVKLPSDVPQSQIERAEKVCGRNPTGGAKKVDMPSGARNDPEMQTLQLKYQKCLHENGFDEPTPDAQGNVTIVASPERRAAMKACRAEEKRLNDRIKGLKEQSDR